MRHLEDEDRRDHAPRYDPADVDQEFIPYLERINSHPFAASVQCCSGHIVYADSGTSPANSTGRWGYLQVLMTAPSATWLCQEVHDREWLILALSKMFGGKAGEMPSYTTRGNFVIAFAWDASHWPNPVEEICSLLDRYDAAKPVEPPQLNFKVPRSGGKIRRPPPPRSSRRRPLK